jgi:hypothetical protein
MAATLLVMLPMELVMTTSKSEESPVCASVTVKLEAVAPGIRVPLVRH